jgi:hypothetical protein
MAGSYPDPPGKRIEYDRDGSALIFWNGSSVVVGALAERQALNDENAGSNWNANIASGWVAVVFPAPMTITGVFAQTAQLGGGSHLCAFDYSLNTTTGADGTWTQFVTDVNTSATAYRTVITSGLPVSNVLAIRQRLSYVFGAGGVPYGLHLYGNRTATTGNWLTLWHPTLDQPLHQTPAFTDLGDDPRGLGNDSFSFRVKNQSSALSANGITLSREALTDGSPTTVSLITLQHNGTGYGTTASVGNLAPGQISAVCDARINVSATAPVGLWAPRIIAAATTWA